MPVFRTFWLISPEREVQSAQFKAWWIADNLGYLRGSTIRFYFSAIKTFSAENRKCIFNDFRPNISAAENSDPSLVKTQTYYIAVKVFVVRNSGIYLSLPPALGGLIRAPQTHRLETKPPRMSSAPLQE